MTTIIYATDADTVTLLGDLIRWHYPDGEETVPLAEAVDHFAASGREDIAECIRTGYAYRYGKREYVEGLAPSACESLKEVISMKFAEVRTLFRRDATRQLPPVEVDGNLLVGDRHIADWEEDHSQYGHDQVRLFPAWYKGKRAWVVQRNWIAAFGYCAEGAEEQILGFEEGVRLVLSLGLFDQLFPVSKPS